MKTIDFSSSPLIMAVLNVTPDSFYAASRHADLDDAFREVGRLERDGADIIDIGAESSRPGAVPLPAEAEWARLGPVLNAVRPRTGLPLSVDTTKAETARRALDAGADMINDISGLQQDELMASTVARYNAYLVIMHMRGTPQTMQEKTDYLDLNAEVSGFLRRQFETAVAAGVDADRILLDPGIGFAKTKPDNVKLLRGLSELRGISEKILVGISRKSFIGHFTGSERPEDRLGGTLAANEFAVKQGASVIRVHDVLETRQFFDMKRVLEQG